LRTAVDLANGFHDFQFPFKGRLGIGRRRRFDPYFKFVNHVFQIDGCHHLHDGIRADVGRENVIVVFFLRIQILIWCEKLVVFQRCRSGFQHDVILLIHHLADGRGIKIQNDRQIFSRFIDDSLRISFNVVHQCATDGDGHQNNRHEYDDFVADFPDCRCQFVSLVHHPPQFQHPEHTQQADTSDDHKGPRRCTDEVRDVGRQNAQYIYQTPETEYVAKRFSYTKQPQQVFDREQKRQDPLGNVEQIQQLWLLCETGNRLQRFNGNADKNGNEQRDIKCFSCRGIRFKNDVVNCPTQVLSFGAQAVAAALNTLLI